MFSSIKCHLSTPISTWPNKSTTVGQTKYHLFVVNFNEKSKRNGEEKMNNAPNKIRKLQCH